MKLIMMTIMVTMMLVTVARSLNNCAYNMTVISGFAPSTLQGEYYVVYTDVLAKGFAYSKAKFSYQPGSQNMTMMVTHVYEKPARGKCSNFTHILDASQANNGLLIFPNPAIIGTDTYRFLIYVIYLDNKHFIAWNAVTLNDIIQPMFNIIDVYSKDIPLTYDELPMAAKAQVMAFCGSTYDTTSLAKSPLKTNIPCTS